MTLRDYQLQSVYLLQNAFKDGMKRVVLQLTTGAGKTVIFTHIAKLTSQKNNSVLVITDRIELLTQAGGTFEKIGLSPQFLTAKTKEISHGGVWVGMVETIKRRLENDDYYNFVRSFTLIIIDEAHRQSFDRLFEPLTEDQYVIGATATPYRTGKMKPLKDYYDTIIIGQQIPDLISTGYLCDAVHYGVPVAGLKNVKITAGEFDAKEVTELYDDQVLYTGVVKNYIHHCNGMKALLFTASVKNSIKLTGEFLHNGIDARHIDANTPANEREQILADYKAGKFSVLSNVGILTTGYDEPSIQCIIVYRPTRSLPLWLQMCGRGSRIFPGKEIFHILDFGENAKRHGLWNANRTWSLEIEKPPKKTGAELVKECPNCGALIPMNAKLCQYCDYIYPVVEKKKKHIEIILEKMTPSEINGAEWNIYELEEIRKVKGYKVGWVLHRLKSLKEYEDYARLKGYKKGWAYYNYNNFGRR